LSGAENVRRIRPFSKKDLLTFWKETQAFALALRSKHGSILTEAWQTELLVNAFIAEITGEFGVAPRQSWWTA